MYHQKNPYYFSSPIIFFKIKITGSNYCHVFKKTCTFFSHNIPTAQSPFCTRLLVLPTINMHRQITSYYYPYPSFSYRFKIKRTIYYYIFKNTYKIVLQESQQFSMWSIFYSYLNFFFLPLWSGEFNLILEISL